MVISSSSSSTLYFLRRAAAASCGRRGERGAALKRRTRAGRGPRRQRPHAPLCQHLRHRLADAEDFGELRRVRHSVNPTTRYMGPGHTESCSRRAPHTRSPRRGKRRNRNAEISRALGLTATTEPNMEIPGQAVAGYAVRTGLVASLYGQRACTLVRTAPRARRRRRSAAAPAARARVSCSPHFLCGHNRRVSAAPCVAARPPPP